MGQRTGLIVETGGSGYIRKGDVIRRTLPLIGIRSVPPSRGNSAQLGRSRVVTDALIGRNGSHYEIRIYGNGNRIGGPCSAPAGRGLVQPVVHGLGKSPRSIVQTGLPGDIREGHVVGRTLPLIGIGGVAASRGNPIQLNGYRIITDTLVG